MGSVWKRLNRINKRASKYKFTASYQELYLEAGPSWQPSSLSVVWTRRGRRIVAAPVTWEPTMTSPYIGMCVWPVPELKEILVTMFRDQRVEEYDNKDWFFVLEDVKDGKRKPVAQGRLNLKDFAKEVPHKENLRVKLRPLSKKVSLCYLTFTLTSEFIKEGKAIDDDMRSVASLVSNSTLQNENDIANLGTLEEETDSEQDEKILVPVSEFQALTKSIQSMNEKLEETILNQQHQQQPFLVQQRPSVDVAKPCQQSSQAIQLSPRADLTTSPFKEQAEPPPPAGNTSVQPRASHQTTILTPKASATPAGLTQPTPTEAKPLPVQPPCDISVSSPKPSLLPPPVVPQRTFPADKTPPKKILGVADDSQPISLEVSCTPTVTTTVQENLQEIKTTKDASALSRPSEMIMDGELVETKPPMSQEERALKMDRTKSQELRDFTKEFVLSTVEDFDPTSFEDFTPTVVRQSIRRSEPRQQQQQQEHKQEIVPSDSFLENLNLDNRSTDEASSSSEASKLLSPASSTAGGGERSSAAGGAEKPAELATRENGLPGSGRTLVSSETFCGPLTSLVTKPEPVKAVEVSPVKPGASNDLLEWAKSSLANYSNVKVTNFTTSWRNGLAFCALIHSFYPGLVDYPSLNAQDIKLNNKLAFQAGEALGIPRVMEPEAMAIKRVPDKLAVITYLHQLRSSLGTAETDQLYESARTEGGGSPAHHIRKSFSEGNIKLFARNGSVDMDKSELPTVMEEGRESEVVGGDTFNKYKQKAKDLMDAARRESLDKSSISPERENTPPNNVILRQKATPKPKRDNRLSYIDNEMKFLDAEQLEIDRQAAILDKRLRETSDSDQLVYDALLQQWFTLVNKKNTLLRRQMQLNILEKEDDLETKFMMLQDELRTYSEMDERRKTDEDREREELLLQELVLVVNQRNELVLQRDDEERMIENDEQIEQDVTIPEERLVQNNRNDCKMQ